MAIDPIGAKAITEIANTLATTFSSPSKEAGAYIADKIRYLRYGSLLKIVKRAEEKAKKEGMLLKMPPIKFFVPFAESASLEEEEKMESLQDAWANLLFRSSREMDARHLLYIRILKEITGRELDFLMNLVKRNRGLRERVWVGSWWHYHDCTGFDQDWIFGYLRNLDPEEELSKKTDIPNLIIENMEQPGICFDSVMISAGKPYKDLVEIQSYYDGSEYQSWKRSVDVLAALNLVRPFDYEMIPFEVNREYSADVSGCVLTDLGIDFYDVCSGEEQV